MCTGPLYAHKEVRLENTHEVAIATLALIMHDTTMGGAISTRSVVLYTTQYLIILSPNQSTKALYCHRGAYANTVARVTFNL